MKALALSSFFAFIIILTGCFKDCSKPKCELSSCEVCATAQFEDSSELASNIEKIVVEPLVIDQSCGCVVSGLVKYLENGKTVALINYGKGECDTWATKQICFDGKCDHKKAKCCKFELDCSSASDTE
jgi:hypothetical protein